jgi:Non-classical export protein 1
MVWLSDLLAICRRWRLARQQPIPSKICCQREQRSAQRNISPCRFLGDLSPPYITLTQEPTSRLLAKIQHSGKIHSHTTHTPNVFFSKCPQYYYLGELQLSHLVWTLFHAYAFASTLDPMLGIFTGVFAYYLYETNPRTAPIPEQKLDNLVRWKIEKYKTSRAKRDSMAASSDVYSSRLLAEAKDK